MRFLTEDDLGVVNFDEYFSYLDAVKESFSDELYEFVADWERYDLNSRKSLHDSRIVSMEFKYNEAEDGGYTLNLILNLRSVYRDRVHQLQYENVESYFLDDSFGKSPRPGDLLLHEFRVSDGMIEHELHFSNQSKIRIKCSGVLYKELFTEKFG